MLLYSYTAVYHSAEPTGAFEPTLLTVREINTAPPRLDIHPLYSYNGIQLCYP